MTLHNYDDTEICEEYIKWYSAETTFAYGAPSQDTITDWWLDKIREIHTSYIEKMQNERDRMNSILLGHGDGCDPRYHNECLEMIRKEVNAYPVSPPELLSDKID